MDTGGFETLVHDLRTLLPEIADRAPKPRAAIFDAQADTGEPPLTHQRRTSSGLKYSNSTAKHGVVLPRRWVVEHSFAWDARFRRLARDVERLPAVLARVHFFAFAMLMRKRVIVFMDEQA